MGRAPCCDKASVKRGPWSPEEDLVLKSYVQKHGTGGNWIALPHRAGLKRCGKSCRLRWLNYLRPDIKHGGFTEEEDNVICSLYERIGSRWSVIASHLPGRTDNDVKNHWNTKLKKKLSMAGKADGNATTTGSSHTGPSSSPSLSSRLTPAATSENHGVDSFSAAVYGGSSSSTLTSTDAGSVGFPEPTSLALPVIMEAASMAASASLASDYSHIHAPGSGNGTGADAFLMDWGMEPMDVLNAGAHGLVDKTGRELGPGETSLAYLWASAQSNLQEVYQSATYL